MEQNDEQDKEYVPPGALSIQSVETFRGHDWEVYVTLSPDGTRLVSVTVTTSYARPVYLWDTIHHTLLCELKGYEGCIGPAVYAPNSTCFATACDDDTVRIWASTGDLIAALPGHKDGVRDLVFASTSSLLFTGDRAGIVRLWDIAHKRIILSFSGSPVPRSAEAQEGGHGSNAPTPIYLLAYSPQQRTLVACCSQPASQNVVYVWHIDDERLEVQWSGVSFPCEASQLIFSPQGDVLAFVDHTDGNGTLHLRSGKSFASDTRIELPRSWGYPRHPTDVRFSPDGRYLAIGEYYGEIEIWDLWEQRPVGAYRAYVSLRGEGAPFPSLTGMDWSRSGLIATAGWNPIGDDSLLKNNFVATLWEVRIEET